MGTRENLNLVDIDDLQGNAADRFDRAANALARSARDMTDRMEDWGQEGIESFRDTVQEGPIFWCAIALGVGAAIGMLAGWGGHAATTPPTRVRGRTASAKAVRTRRSAA